MSDQRNSVLIIAYRFPPENSSGARRPSRFAKYLNRLHYRPVIVTRAGFQETPGSVHIERVPNAKRRSLLLRMALAAAWFLQRILPNNDQLPWVPHAASAGCDIAARHGIGAVVSTHPPVATHLAALWVKKRRSVPWIADFRDPFFGNPFRKQRFEWAYARLVERWIVSNADALVANTDSAGETLRERYPRHAHKVHVIWNGFDPDEVLPSAVSESHDCRIIRHVGTLYGERHPGLLLDSLHRLIGQQKLPDDGFRIELVGPMNWESPWTREPSFSYLKDRNCLTYTNGLVPDTDARRAMAEADCLLLLDLNGEKKSVQVPAKLFDYILTGRPILAFTPAGSPAERILSRSGIDHCCITPGEPPEEIDRKVLEFLQARPTISAPSGWFWREFAAPGQAKILAAMLDGLTGEWPRGSLVISDLATPQTRQ